MHVSLKSEKNNRYFTWRPMQIFGNNLLNEVVEKNQNTLSTFNNFFNRVIYDIM